jgi:hypothetical protein
MSFKNKSTVIYAVWTLDVWGDDGDWTVNDRRRAGSVSVRTDRQNKAGQWDVSNKALTRALVDGHYLAGQGMGYANYDASKLSIDGEDDGVLFVDDRRDGYPLLQREYERHHDVEEKSKGLFGEPSQENPLGFSIGGLSTSASVAVVAAGVAVVGGLGYWFYTRSQTAQQAAAALPVVQTTSQTSSLPVVQTTDQTPAPPNPAAYLPGWLNSEGASPGVDEPPNESAYPGT